MTTLRNILAEADPIGHEDGPNEGQRVRIRHVVVAAASRVDARPRRARYRVPLTTLVAVASFVAIGIVVAFDPTWPQAGSIAQAAVRFEVRLAEDQPGPGLRAARVANSNRSVYLHPEIVVTNADIERSGVIPGDTALHFWIDVRLTAAGAQKMRQATMSHFGRPVAILIDGEVVATPTVKSPIGAAAVISGDFSRADAQRIADGMRIDAP